MLKSIQNYLSLIICLTFLATPSQIFSQIGNLEEKTEALKEKVDKINPKLEKLHIKLENPFPAAQQMNEKVKLGFYSDDINFEEAYEKHYPENYGVLVSSIVSGGNAIRAGLLRGDIIMEFDGEKVRFEEHLFNLRDGKKIGDVVEIVYFRNEKLLKTNLTFMPEPKEELEVDEHSLKPIREKKISPGYGGGGPYVYTIKYDFSEINSFLGANGFRNIESSNLITFGGGGMGNVGNGWFIGGLGAGTEMTGQVQVQDSGSRKYILDMAFGGVTITKKYALGSKRIVLDAGIMLGGGTMDLTMHQTGGTYSWDESIEDLDSYSVHFSKDFFAIRPSMGLMVRIKNWMAIHGSVGYFGSYATDDDWNDQYFNYSVQPGVDKSSPQLPNDLSYSLGFWFGF